MFPSALKRSAPDGAAHEASFGWQCRSCSVRCLLPGSAEPNRRQLPSRVIRVRRLPSTAAPAIRIADCLKRLIGEAVYIGCVEYGGQDLHHCARFSAVAYEWFNGWDWILCCSLDCNAGIPLQSPACPTAWEVSALPVGGRRKAAANGHDPRSSASQQVAATRAGAIVAASPARSIGLPRERSGAPHLCRATRSMSGICLSMDSARRNCVLHRSRLWFSLWVRK